MSNEPKRYSLQTSLTIVLVLVGVIVAVAYVMTLRGQKPADAETEKRWAGELERAFLAFDGVRSAHVEGAGIQLEFSTNRSLAVQKEAALKAARTAVSVRQRLKLDPKVTVEVSVAGTNQYHLVYTEPDGVVEEKAAPAP
jgi:hypothetical protein